MGSTNRGGSPCSLLGRTASLRHDADATVEEGFFIITVETRSVDLELSLGLSVAPEWGIERVKEALCQVLDEEHDCILSSGEVHLIFGDNDLDDEYVTLNQIGVEEDAVLLARIAEGVTRRTTQIRIHPQRRGRRCGFNLDVYLSDSVGVLKEQIEAVQGLPVSQQRLRKKGRLLEDHNSLHAYGVRCMDEIALWIVGGAEDIPISVTHPKIVTRSML